jgi:hypothetical protein
VSISCYVGRFILISDAQWKFLSLYHIYLHLSSYSWMFHQIWNYSISRTAKLEPVKTFISRSKWKFESQYRLATLVQTHLFRFSIVVMLSNRCPNPLSWYSVYVQIRSPNPHSPAESLLCQSLINSYANQLVISISSFIYIYQVYSKDFSKFEPNTHMKRWIIYLLETSHLDKCKFWNSTKPCHLTQTTLYQLYNKSY